MSLYDKRAYATLIDGIIWRGAAANISNFWAGVGKPTFFSEGSFNTTEKLGLQACGTGQCLRLDLEEQDMRYLGWMALVRAFVR